MAKKKSKKQAVKKAVKRPVKKVVAKAARKTAKAPAKQASKPRGFALASVSPGFTVNDAAASIAWYTKVLGFAVKQRWEKDGQLMGAEMTSGAMTLNLGQDDWKMGRDRVKGQGVRLYITTGPQIDTFAEKVKSAGGTLDHEPQDGWGVRAFSITDPDGYKLTFMTDLKK